MFVCVMLAFAATAGAEDRPNIIVIMADDHAQWALGAYGLNEIDTPSIDWLAAEGAQFANAMSPAPVCSAARASFYTGKMPSQHGVHDFLSEQAEFDADWLDGERLLSERLNRLGYRVGLFGKWHATTNSKPPQPGFDRWLSYDPYEAGWQNQYLHSGTVHFSSDGDDVRHTGVQARFLTDEAVRFIDDSASTPFFLSLNFVEPHAPFSGLPERLVSKYRQLAKKLVRAGGSSRLPSRVNTTVPEDHPEQLAQYLAAINLIDEQVGRVVDALHGRELIEKTVIVYTSDHGLLMGQYGLYGKTNATNPPNFYEETVRIPLVVLAPGMRKSQLRHEFVDLLDLHATVLDFASGGAINTTEDGPGRSLMPMLAGHRAIDWRSAQTAERGNARMVTDGRWKLVRYYRRDGTFWDDWYDLVHPLGERSAVAGPDTATRESLTRTLVDFFTNYEAKEHSGTRIWDQPAPNARMRADLARAP
ncbi:MAG: sulfatase-like hydrolase/transferase [Pseudomonadota bacterium]